MKSLFLSMCVLVSMTLHTWSQKQYTYPKAERSTTVTQYFDTLIVDTYRTLENSNLPTTKAWLNDEEKVLSAYRNKLVLEDRILAKLSRYSYVDFKPLHKKGKYFFLLQYDNKELVPALYYRTKIDGRQQKIVDPNVFNTKGHDILSINAFELSLDNRYLAFSLSQNGADWSCIQVVDMENGKYLQDKLENVKFASIAWKGDGFFYQRLDSASLQNKITAANSCPQLFYHKLKTKQRDDIFIYSAPNDVKDKWISFKVTSDERYLTISSAIKQNGTNLRAMFYASLDSFPNINLKPFILSPAKNAANYKMIDNIGDQFVVLTDKNAANKRIEIYNPKEGTNQGRILVNAYKNVLTEVSISKDKIIGLYYLNGTYTACVFDFEGNLQTSIPFPEGCNVHGFQTSKADEETLCFVNSFYFPSIVYLLNLKDLSFKSVSNTFITYDHLIYETKYVSYPSTDGTEIPMYITYKKGMKLNGENPCLLYAYGGFGVIMSPFFSPSNIIWMENGGILAVPQIRGGGEKGEDWHKLGTGLNRFNAFNDFISATNYLINNRYTQPNKLAIEGASNGGLLVGVAMTKHPELFKAAIPQMGVLDMLRYHQFTIASNWIAEYGTSQEKNNFINLCAYSPLHQIRKGIKYPSTLIITSDNDDRVPPLHSYKFAATLQDLGSGENPYLLYVNKAAGHRGSDILNQKLLEEALKLSFLFKNLDVRANHVW